MRYNNCRSTYIWVSTWDVGTYPYAYIYGHKCTHTPNAYVSSGTRSISLVWAFYYTHNLCEQWRLRREHIRELSAFIHKFCFKGEVKSTFLKIRPIWIVDLTCCRKNPAENSKQPAFSSGWASLWSTYQLAPCHLNYVTHVNKDGGSCQNALDNCLFWKKQTNWPLYIVRSVAE